MTKGRIRRDTPAATSRIEGSMIKAKIRSRRRDSGLLMSCPGRAVTPFLLLCSLGTVYAIEAPPCPWSDYILALRAQGIPASP